MHQSNYSTHNDAIGSREKTSTLVVYVQILDQESHCVDQLATECSNISMLVLWLLCIGSISLVFAGRRSSMTNGYEKEPRCYAISTETSSLLRRNTNVTRTRTENRRQMPSLFVNMKTSGSPQDQGRTRSMLPHILLVVLDDVGYNDLGSFSKFAKLSPRIPHMERLMDEGVRLTSFYSQAICSPTRGALMTGRYPMRWRGQHSVATPIHPTWVPEDEVFFPKLMQEVGYYTAAIGKWHLGHSSRKYSPVGRGFHEFYGPYMGATDHWNHTVGEYVDFHHDKFVNGKFSHLHILDKVGIHSTTTTEQFAIEIIDHHDDRHQPLFLYIPFQAPHMPTQDHEEYSNRNLHIRNSKRRRFAGMVSHIDDAIGRIVHKLRSKNRMWDNTLMVLLSDNGGQVTQAASNYPFRGSKSTAWEGGTRVPAFISGGTHILPSMIRGTSFNGLIHVTDIFPTLRDALKKQLRLPKKSLDGISFWEPLIRGETNSKRNVMLYALDSYERLPTETMRSRSEALKQTKKMLHKKKHTRDDYGMTSRHAAIRIGKWKYLEGLLGRDEWFGADPSLAIITPSWQIGAGNKGNIDMQYANKHNIVRLSNTNQRQYRIGQVINLDEVTTKFLFDIESDPLEQHNLYLEMPEKAKQLQKALQQYKREQLPSWDTLNGEGKNPFVAISHGGRKQNWIVGNQPVVDFWENPAVGCKPYERERGSARSKL